ncbi:MAG: DUF4268 domain-containing protein [Acidobacteriaceae bacterium]
MSMPEFGELRRVNLRELWPHEAADFTHWLVDNLQALGKALELELEFVQREAAVGDFACDIIANDIGSGRKVVIENQLEATNHDHLGKLLTYAAGTEAGVIIWVAREMRDEHRQALVWLNARTDINTDFFGVVVEAVRIDESRPALNFKLVASPNSWQRRVKENAKLSLTPREEAQREFFQKLIDSLREVHHFTDARKGQPQSWYTFTTGVSGLYYAMAFAKHHKVRVELYIDFGDGTLNKKFFDALLKDKDAIENAYGQPLDWERLDAKRASRIAIYRPGFVDQNSEQLDELRIWGIKHLLQFKAVFGPRLVTYSQMVEADKETEEDDAQP